MIAHRKGKKLICKPCGVPVGIPDNECQSRRRGDCHGPEAVVTSELACGPMPSIVATCVSSSEPKGYREMKSDLKELKIEYISIVSIQVLKHKQKQSNSQDCRNLITKTIMATNPSTNVQFTNSSGEILYLNAVNIWDGPPQSYIPLVIQVGPTVGVTQNGSVVGVEYKLKDNKSLIVAWTNNLVSNKVYAQILM
ncbi:Uncharacterized protein TCM_044651 [Theobroma cacao]|uniref:Uncharacterized protein n=1 Tax=Theobroma cacao TaxID=3641 RepID=A0A061FRI5_THECC|nr:Uncharacterized protein TCM_044651 [Theobroma cacao]